jgi:type IV secretion system protein VirB10
LNTREPDSDPVQGERTETVSQAPSVQSRVSNILAISLMSVLGLGMLTWYYANAIARQSHSRQAIEAQSKRATSEAPLPSLGRIAPPVLAPPSASAVSPGLAALAAPAYPPPDLPPTPLHEIPLEVTPAPAGYGSPPPKTPAQLMTDRQLSGAAFASQSGLPLPSGLVSAPGQAAPEPGELTALLRPSVTTAVRAQVLPTQRLLLPKGAFIDCTLETAIDSTLPGMTTCIMATDAFGVDGQVVLLERGTKLVGETRGQVQQGSARVFVVWEEARTPMGVIVPLASPGADELGRSGLPGTVDRHFWERFGAAMLVSVIDGAIQAGVQSSRGNNGTVIVNPSGTQDVMTEVLKGTINIPPTVRKQQGDRIQVLVARDLDFRSVYELKAAITDR